MSTAVAVTPATEPTREQKLWRYRVFASTWLCYAGFYFCRKPFSIVKSTMGHELGFDAQKLGTIGAAYLLAYAAGQFVAAWAGNRLGPRINLLAGMAISIAVGIAFGVTDTYATFLALMALSGLSQATGWSGTVGTMANWFHRKERGRVMGWWATNFTVGSLVAGPFAAWVLGHYGYRATFFAGSGVLAAVWFVFLFNQRNRPEDLGLPEVAEPVDPDAPVAPTPSATEPLRLSRGMWTNILLIGLFYFFAKFIRYALWSWAPYFLTENFHQTSEQAGYLSTAFDLAGVPGVLLTGWLSDRVFKSRRALVSFLSMLGVTGATLLLCTLGLGSSTAFVVCLLLLGFTLYGPDALMTGAGAMDVGSRRGAVVAAGLISGLGSIGPVVQELVIGKMYDQKGGDLTPIFLMLLGTAAAGTAALGIMVLRNRLGRADV
jgi:OPA family sugar phosphate sensor protein UhpC-like MFS transporter